MTELLKQNLYEVSRVHQELGREPYFTLARIQSILRQVLTAMEFIHSLHLIHSDLKPENILIKSFTKCEVKVSTSDHLATRQTSSHHTCNRVHTARQRSFSAITTAPRLTYGAWAALPSSCGPDACCSSTTVFRQCLLVSRALWALSTLSFCLNALWLPSFCRETEWPLASARGLRTRANSSCSREAIAMRRLLFVACLRLHRCRLCAWRVAVGH